MIMINQFHDENLIAVNISKEKVSFSFTAKNKILKVSVHGLKKLRVDKFEEANVIARIYLYSGNEGISEKESIFSCLNYVFDINDSAIKNKPDLEAFIEQQYQYVINGDLIILEIEPSYGCYIVALGEKVVGLENIEQTGSENNRF